MCVEDMLE